MFWNIHKLFNLLQIVFSIRTFVSTSMTNDVDAENNVCKSWGSTRINVERIRYTWFISNFSLYDFGNYRSLSSPKFSGRINDSCKWYLDIYPNGYNAIFHEYVSLVLNPVACTPTVKFKLGIINAKLQEINIFENFYNFGQVSKSTVGGIPGFIKKKLLVNNNILIDDKLTVFCELNFTVGVETISGDFKEPELLSNQLGKDLAYLFENPNFGDVIFSVGEKEIKVLSAILTSRSPVFKSMFENEAQGPTISKVDIPDLDYEVVKEMMRYIYTDEVTNLENLASDLLVASEKYKLDGLKTLCAKFIGETLTSENAATFYILGETSSAVDLKVQVKDFIIAHASSVVRTPEFKAMIQKYPQLAEEVFGALSDQLSTSCNNTNQ